MQRLAARATKWRPSGAALISRADGIIRLPAVFTPLQAPLNASTGVAMIRRFTLGLLTATVLLAAGCASTMDSSPAKVVDGVFVGANGMTLYTFDRDTAGSGKSVCNGPCATNWPPLVAAPGASASGDWTVVTRDDGSKQWAYKGKPLYFWAKDQKAGDRTGDGFNGVWRLARP
jgi:predicted lipoprotein with Yx(FWY)xxD motif